MKDSIKIIDNDLKNKIASKYYKSYFEMTQMYENAIEYLENTDKKAFDIYYLWLRDEGKELFNTVMLRLMDEKLDDRFNAFMEVYKTYLEEAIEENCKQIVLEFLYRTPKRMKEDFSNFGFLGGDKQIERQEYIYAFNISDNNAKVEYDFHVKPGVTCQVLLF